MPLPIPKYVQIPVIQTPTVHYKWDDWNVEEVDLPLDEELQKRLQSISQRAVVAFTIATAHWIVYRFGRLSDDPSPGQHLEAAWAQVVHFHYSVHEDINPNEWSGPVRGPLGTAIRRVKFAIQQAEACGDPPWRAGRAWKLAQHVISDPVPYRTWCDQIMTRLQKLYPLNSEEKLGEVVPREALDPDLDFQIEQTELLVNRFLRGLNYRANPFLNSPQQMIEQGFKGTPYVFNIEEDRKARFEW